MNDSLQLRLTESASIVLAAFLGLAGVTLDRAYQQGQDQAMQERLQIHVYTLLASAELDETNQLTISNNLPEPRFAWPDSGLIAYVNNKNRGIVWRSLSSVGIDPLPILDLSPGSKSLVRADHNPSGLNALHYQVIWESQPEATHSFEFVVAESPQGQQDQLGNFRQVLWLGLGGVGFLLVVVQGFVLRWSLTPVRTMVSDLESIQLGESTRLEGSYGKELQGIAVTINKLVENERAHLQRYRNTLSDLAHSLKTPLSVLSGLHQQGRMALGDKQVLREQTDRMREMVDYQLQRAAARGHKTLTASVAINPIIEQLCASLDKVYRDKGIRVDIQMEPQLHYFCESGDLYEMAGNLLDNAYKWASQTVHVSVSAIQDPTLKRSGLCMVIEDDGPGITQDQLDELFQRGKRADESVAGHGIGLAVVKELVELYGGQLLAERSELGGQKWRVILPSRI